MPKENSTTQYFRISALRDRLEQDLIALNQATDGNDAPVMLHRGGIDSQSLRDSLFTLIENVDRESRFVNGLNPDPIGSIKAEAAFWRNVAFLANAVSSSLWLEAGTKP